MDPVAEQLRAINWEYADKDLEALSELRRRVEETGRKFGLISYTDLVRGVEFHYPNLNDGEPYFVNTYTDEWSGIDRRIVGDCLGYISMESYSKAGFMASALVIGRLESQPSDIFFRWMESLGILPDMSVNTVLAYWTAQVKKAHHWYKYGKKI
jgi:hypothetical protein